MVKIQMLLMRFIKNKNDLKINMTANKDEDTLDLGNSDQKDKNNSESISKMEQGEINKKVYEQELKLAVKPGISEIALPKDIEIVFGGSAIFEPGG